MAADQSFDLDDVSLSSSFIDLVREVSEVSIESGHSSIEDLAETIMEITHRPVLQHAHSSPASLMGSSSLDLVRTTSSIITDRPSTPTSPTSPTAKEANAAKAQLRKKLGINKKLEPEPELVVSPTVSVGASDGSTTDSDKSFGCVGMSSKHYSEMLAAGHDGFRKPKIDDEYPKPRHL